MRRVTPLFMRVPAGFTDLGNLRRLLTMPPMIRALPILILTLLPGLAPVAANAADPSDQTVDSAVWLLKKATLVHQDGQHNVLLRALRQLGDADLEPLFNDLAGKSHPALKIHGILALAEISEDGKLDLAHVAELDDPATQARLLSTAIDSGLLSVEQARQMLAWSDLPPPVRIIVVSSLVERGRMDELPALSDALASDNPAVKGTAAMLRLQLGDEGAMEHLRRIDRSGDPSRDQVRMMLLQTATDRGFDRIGPWAMEVARDESAGKRLRLIALRAGVKFDAPEAVRYWRRRYDGAIGLADRIRLATLALDLAEKFPPEAFEPLIGEESELIRRMGRVGRAIAEGREAVEPILDLLEMNHLLASKWIAQHARDLSIDRAEPILMGIIRAAEGGSDADRFRGQRLENVVLAAQRLAEEAEAPGRLFRELFEEVPPLTQEAMLMALIRSDAQRPQRLIAEVDEWPSETARSMALLLRAKHERALTERQLERLGLIVRGGAGLREPLRIQAAWIYLKQTKQDELAIASVLDG